MSYLAGDEKYLAGRFADQDGMIFPFRRGDIHFAKLAKSGNRQEGFYFAISPPRALYVWRDAAMKCSDWMIYRFSTGELHGIRIKICFPLNLLHQIAKILFTPKLSNRLGIQKGAGFLPPLKTNGTRLLTTSCISGNPLRPPNPFQAAIKMLAQEHDLALCRQS